MLMRKAFLVLFVCLALVGPAWAAATPPYYDLDFEMPECLGGWQILNSPRYELTLDRSETVSGQQSLRVRYASPLPWNELVTVARMDQIVDPAEVAGKHVRLSGYIRTDGLDGADGYATFYWFASSPSGFTYADTYDAGARGTTPWTRYQIELDIPADITQTFFGIMVAGNGTTWYDNLQIEVDGRVLRQKAPQLSPPPPGFATWLGQRVLPFTTPVAGHGFADLQGLGQVIGDARIVSLGEATHGTREFFQMKHRLLEYLVEEKGFTHFAIEANMPEAYRLNDYVLNGVGDPAELLEGMYFWTWNTQEVLDMILWMRQYNASGRGTVQFTGFDMQVSLVAVENVRAFLAQAEPAYLPQAEPVLTRMFQLNNIRRPTAADRASARGLFDHLSANRSAYLAAGLSAEKVDWAIQNARVVVQMVEMLLGITPRDASMAANVEWILDHAPAGSKIVLWAHNGHVNKVPGLMGAYLDQRYGDDMYVLGFAFGSGRYNAIGTTGLTNYEAGVTAPDGVEALLAATGIPRFIVDLRGLGNGPANAGPAGWFHEQRLMRMHGAAAQRCALRPTVAADEYDGLIWFDQTHPSVLLPFD